MDPDIEREMEDLSKAMRRMRTLAIVYTVVAVLFGAACFVCGVFAAWEFWQWITSP